MCRYITVRVAGQAPLTSPLQPGQVQLSPVAEWVHIDSDADLRHPIVHSGGSRASAGQDLVEQRLGLVLVGLFRERELADKDLPGLGQHTLLAR